jgi:outer membrane protein assembly factor BamB
MNKKRNIVGIIFLIICVTALMISTSVANDWSQFQKDSRNGAVSCGPAIIEEPDILWNISLPQNNGINVPPIIDDNTAYVFTTNGSVIAYDKYDGNMLWKSQTSRGTALQSSTPALGNGKLFVATNDGELFAFDTKTGDKLWKIQVTRSNFECPVTYNDNKIYVGEGLKGGVGSKYYYCFDENGTHLWKHSHNNSAGFLWNGVSVVNDFVVYTTHEGKVISLLRENGELVDEINLATEDVTFSRTDPGMFRSSITYHEGYLYTSSERGQHKGYVWKIGFDEESGHFKNDGWSTQNGFSTSTPVIYGDRVFVGQGEHGYSGNLSCLNITDGNILWSYPVNAGVKSSPVVATESETAYIYFTEAKEDGSLYCLDDAGNVGWQYNSPDKGYILQGVAMSDGMIYFGTDAGYLYCLGKDISEDWTQFHKNAQNTGFSPSNAPSTNHTLWISDDIGAVPGSSPVIAEGKVYVNCGDYVKSLDINTGEFLANHSSGSTKYNSIASPAYNEGRVWCGLPESANSGTTIAQGKRFEGVWSGSYYCFDEVTDEILWNFSVTGNVQGTPAYSEEKVYLTSWKYGEDNAGHVYCVDSELGTQIWHQDSIKYNSCGSPAIYGDIVYVTTFNFYGMGELYALNKNNGSILWNKSIQRTDSTPAVAYGNVYVAGGCYGYSDMQTYCFDAITGELVWNTTTEEGIGDWLSSVAVADSKIYVGKAVEPEEGYTAYGGTYALDAFTGDIIWESSKGGSSPAIYDSKLYTIAGGKVYAFGDALPVSKSSENSLPGFGLVSGCAAIFMSVIYMERKRRK